MREIITLQVGQCGNQMGSSFWPDIMEEHGLSGEGFYQGESELQLERIDVYFRLASAGRYVPRCVLCDLEPSTLDQIRSGPLGSAFHPENLLHGQNGAGNNWAKGFYTDGAELLDSIHDVLRKETEVAECLQGFQLLHAMGGGTGSGLGTLLLNKLHDSTPGTMFCSFSTFPSLDVSEVVVEPYNTVLAMHQLIDLAQETFVNDNQALFEVCRRAQHIKSPANSQLNQLISRAMSGVTTCFRFPGQLNADLRKLGTNLIPFPRLHFFVPGLAPLTSRATQQHRSLTVHSLTQQMFECGNQLAACDPRHGRYLTVAALFRGGGVSVKEVDELMLNVQNKNHQYFVEWIPCNIKTAVCDVPATSAPLSATFIGNNSAIQEGFRRVAIKFDTMVMRRAFVHWYEAEGVEISELTNANHNVLVLCNQYEENAGNMEELERLDADEEAFANEAEEEWDELATEAIEE